MTVSPLYAFADFELDADRLELRRRNQPVRLNQLSLRLLSVIVQNAERVVTKEELLERVWNGRAVSDNVITVAITRLRKALEQSAEHGLITNVHGLGYKLSVRVAQCERSQTARELVEPMVGRDPVLLHLHAVLERVRAGTGGVVLLMGEAGIGKTRAAEELASWAEAQGASVAWGRCREFGDTPPLWPFSELLGELLAQKRLDPRDERVASALSHVRRAFPELAGLPAAEDSTREPAQKHHVFDGVARLLESAARLAPCVLILDDLHRADPASLELLAYLLDDVPRRRVLFVCGLRPQRGADAPLLSRVLGHRNVLRVMLPRLREADVGSYIEAALGSAPAALRRRVFEQSEGNPFFMTELVRQLRLHGAQGTQGALLPPPAALELLRQRIAALDEVQRDDLASAAVIGRSFSLAVLQSVTGAELTHLIASLDAAVLLEIVAPKPGSRTEFTFCHELLRSVSYDTLEPGERRQRHLRVVHALEQRRGFESVAVADLAYHARAALPLGDIRKTVSYCMSASEAAANVFAYADGARQLAHAREALELLPNPSARLRLRLCLQQALLTRAQSTREFLPLIAQVVQMAHEQGEADTLARSAMLHDPYPGMPALPGAVRAFEAALALLSGGETPPPLVAAMLARLAASPPLAYDAAASGARLGQAQVLAAQSQEVLDEYSVRVARLYLTGGPGQRDAAEQIAELDALYRAHPQVLSVPPLMLELHRALRALQDGALSDMQLALERATLRCRELDSELLWHFERFALIAQLNVGADPVASAALRALHERARSEAITGTELFCAYDEVIVLDLRPRAERLRETFGSAAEDRPNVWSMKVRALSAAGLRDEARALLREVPAARLSALPCDRDYLGTLGALARAAIDLGETDYVAQLYALLQPHTHGFCAHVSFVCEGAVSSVLGLLARALGRRGEAAAHLQAGQWRSASVGLGASAELAARELADLERG